VDALGSVFEERLRDIEAYLDLLQAIESEARSGPPRVGREGALITVQQQRIMYSSVFLQLYNLVESTVVRCLDGVTDAALNVGTWGPGDLSTELRREWVRVKARWLIPLTQVTPYPPSARPSGLAVATDAQLYGRRSILNHGVFLAVSGGPIARQARCGVHLS
jgi:hypothetical protein